jgi:hypothetical protein
MVGADIRQRIDLRTEPLGAVSTVMAAKHHFADLISDIRFPSIFFD